MTNNKRLIVLLTAVLAVGLIATAGMAQTYKFDIVDSTSSAPYDAGDSVTLTITAMDISGVTDKDFTGDVTITGSSEDEALGTATFEASDDGVITVDVTPTVAEATYTVTVTSDADSSVMGTLDLGTVADSGSLGQIELTGPTSSPTVGTSFSVTFTVKDQYGNVVDSLSDSNFYLYSDKDGQLGTESSPGGTDVTLDTTATQLLSAGSHELTLVRDDVSSNSVSVTVNKKEPTLTATNKVVTVGSPTTFTAHAELSGLAKSTDTFEAGREITFTVYDETDTQVDTATIDTGAFGTTGGVAEYDFDLSGASAGDVYTYEASYSDTNYSAVTDTGYVTVGTYTKTNILISASDAVDAGSTVSVDVEFSLNFSEYLSAGIEATVTFDPGEADEATKTVTWTSGEDTTTTKTAAFDGPPTTTAGTYDIKVKFDQNTTDDIAPSEDTGSVTIQPKDTLASFNITNVPASIRRNEEFTVTISSMQDQYGNTFDSTNTNTGWGVSSFEGDSVVITSQGSITAGAMDIKIDTLTTITDMSSVSLTKDSKTKSFNVDVNKTKTKVSLPDEINPNPGENFQVEGVLKEQNPDTLGWTDLTAAGDVDITFNFEGSNYVEATGDDGDDNADAIYGNTLAENDLVAPSSTGQYAMSASWDGSTDYAASSDSSTYGVVVRESPVSSISASIDGPIGADLSETNMTINITGTAGKSLSGLTLVSEHNGAITVTPTDPTFDSSGEATVDTDSSKTLTADSSYEFTLDSNETAGTTFTVEVKKDIEFSTTGEPSNIPLKEFSYGVTLQDGTETALGSGKTVNAKLYEVDAATPTANKTKLSEFTGTTDSDGQVTVALTGPISGKYDTTHDGKYTYELVLEYPGDSTYITEKETTAGLYLTTASDGRSTDLNDGWNLMSLDFQPAKIDDAGAQISPADTKPGQLFGPNTGAVFYWDGGSYVSGTNLTEISPMKGYWFYTNQAYTTGNLYPFGSDGTSKDAKGRKLEQDVTISLSNFGWHMIGSPFDIGWGDVKVHYDSSTYTVEEAYNHDPSLMSKSLISYVEATNDPDNKYKYHYATAPSGTMVADMGYWVKTKVDGIELELPYNAPSEPTPDVASMSMAELGFKPMPEGMDKPPAPPMINMVAGELKATAAVTTSGVTFEVLGADVSSMDVQVFDLSGQEVFSDSASSNSLSWDANVANGIYLYGVTAKVGGEVKPLGIQKLLILK